MTLNGAPVTRYVATVQAYATVSREEELELVRRWRENHDERARDALVRSLLRHVVSIARKHGRSGVPIAELIAEGNFGIVRALEKFDPNRGTLFITYASFWVRACILQHVLRTWSIVGSGLPRSKLFFKLRRERVKLRNLVGEGEHVDALLAERLGIPSDQLQALVRRIDHRDLSLDGEPFAGVPALIHTLTDSALGLEERAVSRELEGRLADAIHEALSILDTRERYIVERRSLADSDAELSLADIGRQLGISRERARQLETRAKTKLRKKLEADAYAAEWLESTRAA